ncbi:MAG TPA: tol-pal system protein YbgF [Candidatus Binatia bacterium]|nr:tol-pal system protein YbgF [Candidatus Binatia bacterium]
MRPMLGALALLLVAGCASRESVRDVATHVQGLRNEVGALRQAQQDALREGAETRAEVKALEERVRELNASAAASGEELTKVRARLTAAEDELKALKAGLAARTEPAAPAVIEKPAPVPPPRAGAPEAMYSAALATFRAREHGQAVLEFLDFLARHPQHALAANAQYWIGEAYYAQRDYRQALVEFQKVLDHPNVNGKWADALLKIGMCHAQLREPARARQSWQRLLAEFPSSPAADRARALLRDAGRAAR